VIGVDGMRQKNADAKNPDQYCCDLDHNTHPYARPALLIDTHIGACWFQNDFVRSRKWFRGRVPVISRNPRSQAFYPS
jgi:hypothetical protein